MAKIWTEQRILDNLVGSAGALMCKYGARGGQAWQIWGEAVSARTCNRLIEEGLIRAQQKEPRYGEAGAVINYRLTRRGHGRALLVVLGEEAQ